ncbi:hypothetical protein, partial [Klebsiella pneumoniae]|uniref:hypothetical protein n=1 Tax=Klebsiella pneumoniae TaxID=573 RepID=UPI001C6F85BC
CLHGLRIGSFMPEKVTSLNGLKVTLEYGSYNMSAHNVYYVKLQTKTSKPLVMRVNLRKPLFSVP